MSVAKERKQVKQYIKTFIERLICYFNAHYQLDFHEEVKVTCSWHPSRRGSVARSGKGSYRISLALHYQEMFDYRHFTEYSHLWEDKEIGNWVSDNYEPSDRFKGLQCLLIHEMCHLIRDYYVKQLSKKLFKQLFKEKVSTMPAFYPNKGYGDHGLEWQYLYRECRKFHNLTSK